MTTLPTAPAVYDRAYSILVEHAGAPESMRGAFVRQHVEQATDFVANRWDTEWRFCGSLGYGGKFWVKSWPEFHFTVNCYREDETPERLAIIEAVNLKLKELVK